jgi:hypothetical protein
MNRRQRRADGHRGRAQHLAQAIRCPDCNADVEVTKVGHGHYSGEVRHDDTCPWYQAFQHAGGFGIRFGHTQHDEGDT